MSDDQSELQKRLLRLNETDAIMLALATPATARVFAAVRGVLEWFDVDEDGLVSPLESMHEEAKAIRELEAAYYGLGIDAE